MKILTAYVLAIAAVAAAAGSVQAVTYEVGPGLLYENINDVPWESIAAGDTVLINWREAPYKEKWVICAQGTEAMPITVRGVPGPNGELPLIDGNEATTRPQTNFWGDNRSIIKIGGANIPADLTPAWIVVENLEIASGRPPYYYYGRAGRAAYVNNAAAIYVEKCENLVVRNCIIRDCGNGFFVASSDAVPSRNILLEGCYLYDNSMASRTTEHNSYCAAIGITYQYNRYGRIRTSGGGVGLKDRSAAMVVRYNWLEMTTTAGGRELDFVEGQDSIQIREHPEYKKSYAYGNVVIEGMSGNRQVTHYGGDSGDYRRGVLYFYNNTIVQVRTDRNTLFRISSSLDTVDARNNVFYTTLVGSRLELVSSDSPGTLIMDSNWLKPGYTRGSTTATIVETNTVTGDSPGFVDEANQDYHLAIGSQCINAGGPLAAAVPAEQTPRMQYTKHQTGGLRPVDGHIDIGAYEYQITAAADIKPDTINLKSSGKYITVYISMPEPYSASDIDPSTVYLLCGGASIYAVPAMNELVDVDDDGVMELMVKFSRQDVQAVLTAGESVGLNIGGWLVDDTGFWAEDAVRVIH